MCTAKIKEVKNQWILCYISHIQVQVPFSALSTEDQPLTPNFHYQDSEQFKDVLKLISQANFPHYVRLEVRTPTTSDYSLSDQRQLL